MDEGRAFPIPAETGSGRESRGHPTASPETRMLAINDGALRRQLQTLRVQCWRGEDRVRDLEAALQAAESAREEALHRLREREAEIEMLYRLAGGGAFFERGFRLGHGVAIVGTAARRPRAAPSGTMIFGPYLRLPPGRYAAEIAARLYGPAPLSAQFTVDAVCAGGRETIATRRFRVWPLMRAQRHAFAFTVPEGFDRSDLEVRIWARRGTPLEVSRLDLRLLDRRAPRVFDAIAAGASSLTSAGAT